MLWLLFACSVAEPSVPTLPADPPTLVAEPVFTPPPPPRVRLLAAGDVIPHPAVAYSAVQHGWDSLFADVKAEVQAADLAILNLETPVAPEVNGHVQNMVFNAPVELPTAIREAGFDAVSLANNHVWDQGRAGLLETVKHLDELGVVRAGAGRTCAEAEAPRIFTLQGVKIGWVSSTRVHNLYLNRGPEDPCVFSFDLKKVLASVKAARDAGAELVVLSLHWGYEYEPAPRSWDRTLAKQLVAGGVDAILGHHPHVLQPAEWIESGGRRGFVIFSLGNFISAQAWTFSPGNTERASRRDGGLLELVAERVDGVAKFTSARLLPTWTEHGGNVCDGRPSRVRAILLGPAATAAAADPTLAACAKLYQWRLSEVRRVVGEEHVGG